MAYIIIINCEQFAFGGFMKKVKIIVTSVILVLVLALGIFLLFFLARDRDDYKVVVTTFPIYDICREILGSGEDVLLLQDNGADLHDYRPTASDISSISKANLFVFIGGHSDNWVGGVVKSADNVNLKALSLVDCVDLLHESTDNIIEGGHAHEDHEHEHDGDCVYDEHIWLSIKNMKKMTLAILDELIKVYPHQEQILIANAEEYIEKLDSLDMEYSEALSGKSTTIVVADRFPFLYLANDYSINFLAAYHGCSSDTQASASLILELIEKVNEDNLNYVCILEGSDGDIARSVVTDSRCREGVTTLQLNSCQSIKGGIDNVSYIDIMKSNLINLRKAINNESN